jgi:SAM-dependent methyltransferase
LPDQGLIVDQADILINEELLGQRKLRALKLRRSGADFLLQAAIDDLQIRLETFSKSFDTAVDLSSYGAACAHQIGQQEKVSEIAALSLATLPDRKDSDQGFDLIISLFDLQWRNNIPQVLSQISSRLKPDGLLIGCVCGGETLNELRQVYQQVEAEMLGGLSPRFLPRIELSNLGDWVQQAGLSMPVTDRETVNVRYKDLDSLIADLRGMGATNCLMQRDKRPLSRQFKREVDRVYQEKFSGDDGRLTVTFDLLWFSAWKPHSSHPKPLRRGSATTPLADALKIRTET